MNQSLVLQKNMKPSAVIFSLIAMLAASLTMLSAGPVVVLHLNSKTVKVWNNEFEVVHEFRDHAQIKVIQDVFSRAKKIGNTSSYLKTPTHKIDFSDRWLIDLNTGEFGMLSKQVRDVYQLEAEDLEALKRLIPTKAEQIANGNSVKPSGDERSP